MLQSSKGRIDSFSSGVMDSSVCRDWPPENCSLVRLSSEAKIGLSIRVSHRGPFIPSAERAESWRNKPVDVKGLANENNSGKQHMYNMHNHF